MPSCSLIYLFISSYLIYQTLTQTILSPGATIDDWSGWNNFDMSITNNSTNKQYHGIFDGDYGETTLSRNDIELETTGILIMNFTLIFGCEVIDNIDKITVSIGTTSKEYYFQNTLDKYSHIDDILFPLCNDSVWSIKSFIQSNTYDANTPIHNISFISSFNYEIPYDETDKYWAVTDIIFTFQAKDFLDVVSADSNATLISIIVVLVILFILLVILFRYLYKSRKIRNRKKKYSYKSIQLSQKELSKTSNKSTKKSKKSKKQKQKENEAILNENKQLKVELEEFQSINNQLLVRKMNRDNQMNEAIIKIQNMKQVIGDLENNIHTIKKENAAKELELMRKDEQINKQLKEQAMIAERLKEIKSEQQKNEKKVNSNETVSIPKTYVDNMAVLTEVNVEWIPLENCNENSALFAVNHKQFGALCMDNMKIYKYKSKDKWNFFAKIPKGFKSSHWLVCGDRHRELIYIYGNFGEMVVINNKGKMDTFEGLDKTLETGSKCVLMNGNVHILGGLNNWHLLWNSKIKLLKKVRMNESGLDLNRCEHFEAVGLCKRGMLLVFGGSVGGICKDEIWKYEMNECVWKKLDVKLPYKMHSFGCCVSENERYVIIFGGVGELNRDMDGIFVLDVNDMSLKRSDVKCPVEGKVKVLLMGYSAEYKLVLSGLVRECGNTNVSEDIFDMMMKWIVTNDVHLIDESDGTLENGTHWRMNVAHIVGV